MRTPTKVIIGALGVFTAGVAILVGGMLATQDYGTPDALAATTTAQQVPMTTQGWDWYDVTHQWRYDQRSAIAVDMPHAWAAVPMMDQWRRADPEPEAE